MNSQPSPQAPDGKPDAVFHFSLGPVQEFVGQARRTRDYWAASFLLSWLCGVAQLAAQALGARILHPQAAPGWLERLQGKGDLSAAAACHGALPNRFSALVSAQFDGAAVARAVREAWQALGQHALQTSGLTLDAAAQAVWRRQFGLPPLLQAAPQNKHGKAPKAASQSAPGFWDAQWLILPAHSTDARRILDARKQWPSHWPPKEGGVQCSLMPGWQEISGAPDPKPFWQETRQAGVLDWRVSARECLSAPALLKRLFDRDFASFRHHMQVDASHSLDLCGWEVAADVPSTLHLAALPWLAHCLRTPACAQARAALLKTAQQYAVPSSERAQLSALQALRAADPNADALCKLDPAMFFADGIAFAEDWAQDTAASDALQKSLHALQKAAQAKALPLFALLKMDGDQLGQLLALRSAPAPVPTQASADDATADLSEAAQLVASALQEFTQAAQTIVQAHSGYLLYAGGDDVLALAPAPQALDCVCALRRAYQQAFAALPTRFPACALAPQMAQQATISAALALAHYQTPLTALYQDVSYALDQVAKARHGRDSLALRLWKGQGLCASWGMPWEAALAADGQLHILHLARGMAQQEGLLSGSFLQRGAALWRELDGMADEASLLRRLEHEYGHSLYAQSRALSQQEVRQQVQALWQCARQQQRVADAQASSGWRLQPLPREVEEGQICQLLQTLCEILAQAGMQESTP